MSDIATTPTLVVPGLPDASRVYQSLLSFGHNGPDGTAEGEGPGADEIEAVRDWIAGLPPTPEDCGGRPRIGDTDIRALADQWQTQIGTDAAGSIRFVSLAHLSNACRDEAALARFRNDLAQALGRHDARSEPAALDVIGDLSALIALKPEDAGFSPKSWDAMAAMAPRTFAGAVPADWLANHIDPAATTDLAADYRADVDLIRAAAEAGLDRRDLLARLDQMSGSLEEPAKQLRQGFVSRGRWEALFTALQGSAAPVATASDTAVPPTSLRLQLWTDRMVYSAGDVVTLSTSASADCHLTLISVDTRGQAIVLHPSGFQPESKVHAETRLNLPPPDGAYQLRVKDAGTETIVGICDTARVVPRGIAHDFERAKFTPLGDWRIFVRGASGREATGEATAAQPAASVPEGVEARTAITITVTPPTAPAP